MWYFILLIDGDIRIDDSVYTYVFSAENSVEGTVIKVKSVTIIDYNRPTRSTSSDLPTSSDQKSKVRQPGQGLFTIDPFESECCGSVVNDPDIPNNHQVLGFSYIKYHDLPVVTISRVS